MVLTDYHFSEAQKIIQTLEDLIESRGQSAYVVCEFNEIKDAVEYMKAVETILSATSNIKLLVKEVPRYFYIQAYSDEADIPTKRIKIVRPEDTTYCYIGDEVDPELK
jgi:hypothetical protein